MNRSAFILNKPKEDDVVIVDPAHMTASEARYLASTPAEQEIQKILTLVFMDVEKKALNSRFHSSENIAIIQRHKNYFKALGYKVKFRRWWEKLLHLQEYAIITWD